MLAACLSEVVKNSTNSNSSLMDPIEEVKQAPKAMSAKDGSISSVSSDHDKDWQVLDEHGKVLTNM